MRLAVSELSINVRYELCNTPILGPKGLVSQSHLSINGKVTSINFQPMGSEEHKKIGRQACPQCVHTQHTMHTIQNWQKHR